MECKFLCQFGYSASEIEGETEVDTGFVIYEGEIDWDTYTLVEDGTTTTSTQAQSSTGGSNAALVIDETESETTNEENDTTSDNTDEDTSTNTISDSENASEASLNTDTTNTSNVTDNSANNTIDENNTANDTANEGNSMTNDTDDSTSKGADDGISTVATSSYYLSEYGYSEEESEAIWDLQCSVTQWVWIPVSEDDLEDIYGIDSEGKYWGKTYSQTSKTTATNWTETDGVMSITSSTGYREPDTTLLLTAYDTDDYLETYLNGITRYEFSQELENNFYETIESIKTYGGFYVGRYETGDLSEDKASVTKANSDINYQTWYVMYEKCEGLSNENTNVRTSMIWDCLYDYIYRWFIDSGATKQDGTLLEESEIWSGINGGSRSWGNYAGSEFTYYTDWDTTATKEEGETGVYCTGFSYYTAINNVFDLAGDVCDRTLNHYGTQYVVWRGDNADDVSNDSYAAYRGSSSNSRIPTYSGNSLRLSSDTFPYLV